MAQLPPNINWLTEYSGKTVQIELAGKTFRVAVEEVDDDE